ncbi:DUF6415 family natural product biosynthesis protein [Streptomyces niveus]|uniref:DUF6415 family natural product biosynthesis protein n=1 Tax=Streptomyces niveus TaxID=193462 RepID=UPI00084CCE84|nr:DUF6415 family natural product biosynthesis protein [Streptomyces niveus]
MPLHDAPTTTAIAVDAGATVTAATPEHAVRVMVDLARQQVETLLGDGAKNLTSQDLSDHALRLRGCLRPLSREVENGVDEGERVVAAVLKDLDADGPPGLMAPKVRAVRLAHGVQVLLDVLDGADPAHVLYEPDELSAGDVRVAIRLARSWQESGIAPHPDSVGDVVRRLRGAIGMLVLIVEYHRAGLPLTSPVRRAAKDLMADAEELAAKDVPTVPVEAVAYAAGLGEYANRLLRLAESDQLALFELTAPVAPPVPMTKQPARREGTAEVRS